MHTSRFIHKLSLIIITITFIVAQTATAQVPFNKGGSVAGKGVINSANSNATGMGVRGIATSATGATKGLYGKTLSRSNNAIGVYGFASSNLSTTGFTYGVWGQSNSKKGRGVYGVATKTTGPTIGVFGLSKSPGGKGVYGRNTGGGYAGYFDGKFGVKGIMRMIPNSTSPNIIGGHSGNAVTNGSIGATISGGGASLFANKVTDNYGTVGGGRKNQAGGLNTIPSDNEYATVGGGYINTAVGSRSTIAGGYLNYAVGDYSTIAGGDQNQSAGARSVIGGGANNQSTGSWATVPGGSQNVALGNYSFAAGRRAKANFNGSFVWGDSTAGDIASTANNQVIFRASGGYKFYTGSSLLTGAVLYNGQSAWTTVSDRNMKKDIVKVDSRDVLDKLSRMEIATWQYKDVEHNNRHMGPMAQDFYSAYQLGFDDKGISTVDADGVALAAIQGLYDVVKENKKVIAEKDAMITKLQVETTELKSRLLAIESKLGSVVNADYVVSSLEK